MVQRVEHFGAELQVQPFTEIESFPNPQIEIPVTWCFEDIAAGAVGPGRRYGETGGVLENYRTDNSGNFLQPNLRLRSNDIRARLMRKIRGPYSAAHSERLS